jgi:hypothetical protein
MPQNVDLSAQVWSEIDHGFRFLFFETYIGWLLLAALIVAAGVRVMRERRWDR